MLPVGRGRGWRRGLPRCRGSLLAADREHKPTERSEVLDPLEPDSAVPIGGDRSLRRAGSRGIVLMVTWWTSVLPVVTLILGYFGTLLVDSRRTSAERRASEETRRAIRDDSRSDARRSFEIETLLALQEALSTMVRALGKAHHFDIMSARDVQGDRYINFQLPGGISDEIFVANRDVARLEGRVLDERIRKAVEVLRAEAAIHGVRPDVTVSEGERGMLRIAELVDDAQRLISTRVRGIYDGSIAC